MATENPKFTYCAELVPPNDEVCGQLAEITDEFTLGGTGGRTAHVATRCMARHILRMPAEYLDRFTPNSAASLVDPDLA